MARGPLNPQNTVDVIEDDINRLNSGEVSRDDFVNQLQNRAQSYPDDSLPYLIYNTAATEFSEETTNLTSPTELVQAFINALAKVGNVVPEDARPSSRDGTMRDARGIDRATNIPKLGEYDEQRIGWLAHAIDNENQNNPGVDETRLRHSTGNILTPREQHAEDLDQLREQVAEMEREVAAGRQYDGVSNDYVEGANARIDDAISGHAYKHKLVSGISGTHEDNEIRVGDQIVDLGDHIEGIAGDILRDLDISEEDAPGFKDEFVKQLLQEGGGRIFSGTSQLTENEIRDALDEAVENYTKGEFDSIEHAMANRLQMDSGVGATDEAELTSARERLNQMESNTPAATAAELEAERAERVAALEERRAEIMQDIADDRREIVSDREYDGVSNNFVADANAKLEAANLGEHAYKHDLISGISGTNANNEIRVGARVVDLGDHIDGIAADIMETLEIDNPQLQEELAAELLERAGGRAFSGTSALREVEITDALDAAVKDYSRKHGDVRYDNFEHFMADRLQAENGGPNDLSDIMDLGNDEQKRQLEEIDRELDELNGSETAGTIGPRQDISAPAA